MVVSKSPVSGVAASIARQGPAGCTWEGRPTWHHCHASRRGAAAAEDKRTCARSSRPASSAPRSSGTTSSSTGPPPRSSSATCSSRAPSPLIGTLSAFGTFAVGFAARPLGGVVFGHFGDRVGRKAMLVTSLLIMGLATFLIGCLPTHASIGIAGPDPARGAALRAGHRRRRRVGWRGADVRRARAEGQARLLRRVPADGRAGRPAALDGRFPDGRRTPPPRTSSWPGAGASRS